MNEFSEQYLNGCSFGFRVDLLKRDQINNELEVWRDSSFGGAAVFFFFLRTRVDSGYIYGLFMQLEL
jgi:hypothetical protein